VFCEIDVTKHDVTKEREIVSSEILDDIDAEHLTLTRRHQDSGSTQWDAEMTAWLDMMRLSV
jgi:hypothetical protein